jgi:hypothetical protein
MPGDETTQGRTFDEFAKAVRSSCETHAQRKNYTSEGIDGKNQLLVVCKTLGIHDHHAIGEIIYKATEYLKAPTKTRKILLEKIAGWSFVLWRELPEDHV